LDGPVVLAGHAYGGAVITEAGSHPAVAHLVYLSGLALDDGESYSDAASEEAVSAGAAPPGPAHTAAGVRGAPAGAGAPRPAAGGAGPGRASPMPAPPPPGPGPSPASGPRH